MILLALFVVSVLGTTASMALVTYFYKDVKEFIVEIILCINPSSACCEEWFPETMHRNSNSHHVRINSTIDTVSADDGSVISEKLPYSQDWSNTWCERIFPLSPVTRSMVTNVFTRTRLEEKNRLNMTSSRAWTEQQCETQESSGENCREMVVMPAMYAINPDPVVLSRGYRIVENREINALESVQSRSVEFQHHASNANTMKTITISSVTPHSSASPAYLAVCQEIDQYLASIACAGGTPLPNYVAETEPNALAASVPEGVPHIVDATTVANPTTASLMSPIRRIRYTSSPESFDINKSLVSSSNDSTIETTSSSAQSMNRMHVVPLNEKTLDNDALYAQYVETKEPACSPEHSMNTIYDLL